MDRDDLRSEIEADLARLGEATKEMEPDPPFTSALMDRVRGSEPMSDPLAGIAERTASLDPGDDFSRAVMERARRAQVAPRYNAHSNAPGAPSWIDGVVRSGPIAIGAAVLAAAASVLLFWSSQQEVNASLAASVDMVEVGE